MKCLVYTPFRCGSSYLCRFIEKNINAPIVFYNNYKEYQSSDNIIIKSHISPIDFDINFDYVFTCIRKPTDIFPSAFIKDFKTNVIINNTENKYPYFYEKEVSENNIKEIINFFLSFSWENFNWMSYDFNFSMIEKLTGINVWNESFDKQKGYTVFNTNPKLVVITHDILFNKTNNFQELCKRELNFIKIGKDNYSYRNSDTYGDFYKNFLENIPEDFYKKYKYLDDRIVEKFL